MDTPGLRVLLVDDDHAALQTMCAVLADDRYTVTTATSGIGAIHHLVTARLAGVPFTVVVTDIRMEHVDGLAVMQIAAAQEPPPAIILITAYPVFESWFAGLQGTVFAYLVKPFSIDVLGQYVHQALGLIT